MINGWSSEVVAMAGDLLLLAYQGKLIWLKAASPAMPDLPETREMMQAMANRFEGLSDDQKAELMQEI